MWVSHWRPDYTHFCSVRAIHSPFWPPFYIVVLGMTFFKNQFTFSNFYMDFYFPFSIWTFVSLFYLDFHFFFFDFISFLDFYFFQVFFFNSNLLFPIFIWTFIYLFSLDFYFPFLLGLLLSFSLWTFISLFFLDFYFPFLFGLLFNGGRILDFFQKFFVDKTTHSAQRMLSVEEQIIDRAGLIS